MIDSSIRAAVAERAAYRCDTVSSIATITAGPSMSSTSYPVSTAATTPSTTWPTPVPRCNRYKDPNLTAIDPETGRITTLFNPRIQVWTEHFKIVADRIEGITAVGRATARLLKMNAENRRDLRYELEPD